MNLSEIYYDPSQGFLSASKLYEKLKHKGYKLSEIQNFVKSQQTYQINKQKHKPNEYKSIVLPGYKNNFQIDIIIYDRYEYHKYNAALMFTQDMQPQEL